MRCALLATLLLIVVDVVVVVVVVDTTKLQCIKDADGLGPTMIVECKDDKTCRVTTDPNNPDGSTLTYLECDVRKEEETDVCKETTDGKWVIHCIPGTCPKKIEECETAEYDESQLSHAPETLFISNLVLVIIMTCILM